MNIEPMDNGWLVVDRTTKGRKVFTDREKMMEYINEIVPATREEQGFIDGLNDESDDESDESYNNDNEEEEMEAMVKVLEKSFMNIKGNLSNKEQEQIAREAFGKLI